MTKDRKYGEKISITQNPSINIIGTTNPNINIGGIGVLNVSNLEAISSGITF